MSLVLVVPGSRSVSSDTIPASGRFLAISPAQAVVALILVSGLARILISASVGLGIDESYTVANARHFAWSYVDYPPLHVWLVGAWSRLCGTENSLIVRLPFVAIFAGSTWMMFRLTALLFGERAGAWAALMLNLAPVFTLPHASWVLPDGPLALFMLLSAYAMALALFREAQPPSVPKAWIAAGLFAGLAMLTKYHGAFLLAGAFVFLLTWSEGRRILNTPWPWIAAALALLVFLPVIAWNAQHDWVGLFFQSRRITKSTALDPMRVIASIVEQAAYLSPWLFVALAAVWLRALRAGRAFPKAWFLAILAGGPIIFFTAANLFSRGLPHWPMPGWLLVFPLLGAELARAERLRPKLVRTASASAALLLATVLAIFSTNGSNGWLAQEMPAKWSGIDPTLDLLNWSEIEPDMRQRHLLGPDTAAVAGTRWFEAGKLNYAMGRDVPVVCLCADPQQFRYLHGLAQFAGRNILIIEPQKEFARHGATFAQLFDRFQPLAPIVLHRAGAEVLQLAVIRGVGFHLAQAERFSGGGIMK
jgi:4-amino-4-deoxy-L-arabinose transferase-like glycosyltransferase